MARIVIEGDVQDRVFSGERIAGPVSTRLDRRRRQRARWMTGELFRKDEGAGYVLYIVNWSNVWHLLAGADHVRKPRQVRSADLPDEAVYCGVMPVRPDRGHCPVYWGDGGNRVTDPFRRQEEPWPEMVVAELPQRKINDCPDYPSLIEQMTTFHKRGATSVMVSEPMAELIAQAAEVDPAFRERRVASL